MKILKQSELEEAAELLNKKGVVAFPTETVFGLGVVFDDKKAYDKLISVKRRPPEKPFTLMLSDVEDVKKYAKLNKISSALVNAFMPGQFTLITEAQPGLPNWCVSKEGKIGIRIADYDLIRNLIRKTKKPLLVPSANKSGEPPATKTADVVAVFDGEIEGVIEGESVSNVPSTIVLVDGSRVSVIREGNINLSQINDIIEKELAK